MATEPILCFMDKGIKSGASCSGPAKEWRPKLAAPDPKMVMYACDKHFHEVWAGEN